MELHPPNNPAGLEAATEAARRVDEQEEAAQLAGETPAALPIPDRYRRNAARAARGLLTLVALLVGFWDPESGAAVFDSLDEAAPEVGEYLCDTLEGRLPKLLALLALLAAISRRAIERKITRRAAEQAEADKAAAAEAAKRATETKALPLGVMTS